MTPLRKLTLAILLTSLIAISLGGPLGREGNEVTDDEEGDKVEEVKNLDGLFDDKQLDQKGIERNELNSVGKSGEKLENEQISDFDSKTINGEFNPDTDTADEKSNLAGPPKSEEPSSRRFQIGGPGEPRKTYRNEEPQDQGEENRELTNQDRAPQRSSNQRPAYLAPGSPGNRAPSEPISDNRSPGYRREEYRARVPSGYNNPSNAKMDYGSQHMRGEPLGRSQTDSGKPAVDPMASDRQADLNRYASLKTANGPSMNRENTEKNEVKPETAGLTGQKSPPIGEEKTEKSGEDQFGDGTKSREGERKSDGTIGPPDGQGKPAVPPEAGKAKFEVSGGEGGFHDPNKDQEKLNQDSGVENKGPGSDPAAKQQEGGEAPKAPIQEDGAPRYEETKLGVDESGRRPVQNENPPLNQGQKGPADPESGKSVSSKTGSAPGAEIEPNRDELSKQKEQADKVTDTNQDDAKVPESADKQLPPANREESDENKGANPETEKPLLVSTTTESSANTTTMAEPKPRAELPVDETIAAAGAELMERARPQNATSKPPEGNTDPKSAGTNEKEAEEKPNTTTRKSELNPDEASNNNPNEQTEPPLTEAPHNKPDETNEDNPKDTQDQVEPSVDKPTEDDKGGEKKDEDEEEDEKDEQVGEKPAQDAQKESESFRKPVEAAPPMPFEPQSENSHFMTYLISGAILVAVAYVLFHNKQKVLGLIVEGRGRGGSTARRSGAKYTPLAGEEDDREILLSGGEKKSNIIY